MTAVFMGDRMLIHLVFEAQMFDLVRPVAAELRSSRTCRIYDPSTDERLYARLIDSINGFERWRRDVTAAKSKHELSAQMMQEKMLRAPRR